MKYSVDFLFKDAKGSIQRKIFDFETDKTSLSIYDLFTWAEVFEATKIIFNKKENEDGESTSIEE